jgi:outer membrane PBP1 activator LpoA protein
LPRQDGAPADYPSQIALLLPLSGRNANAGAAIRNGFFGAYFSSASELEEPQTIRVYDVAGAASTRDVYDRALADGAEFVVGPLLRPEVTQLVGHSLLPVPVLALNYLPDEVTAPPGVYQFALAPEDEAASAATRAIADGHRRALALVPNNDWGRRVLDSFATTFESLGGTLLDFRNYQPSSQDFSFEIEGLMALADSVQRYQRLRANLGSSLQFDPRRRQDADFVFLAADAKAGRLLKSQLKFHYAGDLPVYATSFIYAMDGRSDADLNGVMFADTPWLLSPPPWIADLPALYNDLWPEERRLGRLHAMGYDAYRLVGRLAAARTEPMEELAGATGTLYLDDDGRVHRRLAWARFVRGEPAAVPDARAQDSMLRELEEESAPIPANQWPGPSRNQ